MVQYHIIIGYFRSRRRKPAWAGAVFRRGIWAKERGRAVVEKERQSLPEERGAPEREGLLIGRNAVAEALRSGRAIESIYIQRGGRTGSAAAIVAKASARGIPIKEVDVRKLDHLSRGGNHQGVAASVAVKEFATMEDVFALAEERQEPPFLILCDELEDPHNLGAVIRIAECAGAHGVVIPKRRSVGLSYSVGKASAGAVEYMPVVRVTNMAAEIDKLKERGVWVYAADMAGEPWCQVDYAGPCALVIGSEGKGISKLVREKSDVVVSLPMKGKINSLNASVACGVIAYEIARQRAGLAAVGTPAGKKP